MFPFTISAFLKKFISYFIVCAFPWCFIYSVHADEKSISISIASGEWFPYTSESLEHFGVFSEIVTKAFKSQGISVNYEFLPWARAFRDTQHGKYDASMTWAKKKEWQEFFDYSENVVESRKVLFYNHSNPFSWNDYPDLVNKKIAIINSYTYGEVFDYFAEQNPHSISKLVREEQAFRMLALKRIDAFASDIIVGYAYAAKLIRPELQNMITHHPKPLDITTLHVVFPKTLPKNKRENLILKFNTGLEMLRESGQLDEILLKSMMPTRSSD